MIFTIGYEALTPARLQEIAHGLSALVIDVRAMPRSRKPGFSKSTLTGLLGPQYVTMGHVLGGRGNTSPHGITALRTLANTGQHALLLCMEAEPGDCHRHHTICGPYFPEAIHIFEDELLRAADLSASLESEDGEYSVIGSLAQLLQNPKQARKLLA